MAEWKYIAYGLDETEPNVFSRTLPIIFPNELIHSEVARVMHRVLNDNGRRFAPVISAGFVNGLSCVATSGLSESLDGLKSRAGDATVINEMPYASGRESGISVEKLLLLKTIEMLIERAKSL